MLKVMRITFLISLVVFFTAAALGHEGNKHVKGTVITVTESSISIKTLKGETVTVSFDQETKFLRSRTKAQAGELQVGDRVVVDTHEKNDTLHAAQVRFGTPKKAAADHSNHQQRTEKR